MGLLIHQNHPKQIPKVTNPYGKYPNNKEEKNLNILIFSLYFNPRLGTKKAGISHAKTQFLPKWHVGIFRNFMGGFQCPKSIQKYCQNALILMGTFDFRYKKKFWKKFFWSKISIGFQRNFCECYSWRVLQSNKWHFYKIGALDPFLILHGAFDTPKSSKTNPKSH